MGVECAVQGGCRGYGVAGRASDAPRSGGWVRGAREGAGWFDQGGGVVVGQVLGGDEISSGRPKNAFVFDFLFAFGRLVGDTRWLSA
jgi:hypothetical protein